MSLSKLLKVILFAPRPTYPLLQMAKPYAWNLAFPGRDETEDHEFPLIESVSYTEYTDKVFLPVPTYIVSPIANPAGKSLGQLQEAS